MSKARKRSRERSLKSRGGDGADRAPRSAASPTTSGWRALARWALLVGLTILAIEGTAWVAYWVLDGTPFSYQNTWRDQSSWATRDLLTPDTTVPVDRRVEHVFASQALALHPFLGFAIDPRRGSRRAAGANELGFSGPSLLEPREPNELRVAILGGSVAYGLWLEGRTTMVEVLGESDGCDDRPIRVFSAAVGGYKQPQQLIALSYSLALGAEIDVVVNVDGFNDIVLAPRGHDADSYLLPRNWSTYTNRSMGPQRMGEIGRAMYYRESRRQWATLFHDSVLRYSVLGNLVWWRVDRTLGIRDAEAQETLERRFDFEQREPGFRSVGGYDTTDDLYVALATLWADASVAMHQLMVGGDGHYFHFLQPNQYDEGAKPLTRRERARAFQADHPYREHARNGYPHLRDAGEVLTAADVAFHDLSGLFVDSNEEIYSDTCCHFTRRGYKAIARAVASAIVDTTCGP